MTDQVDGIARIPTHGPGPRQESDVDAALEPNPKPNITPLAELDPRATSGSVYDLYQESDLELGPEAGKDSVAATTQGPLEASEDTFATTPYTPKAGEGSAATSVQTTLEDMILPPLLPPLPSFQSFSNFLDMDLPQSLRYSESSRANSPSIAVDARAPKSRSSRVLGSPQVRNPAASTPNPQVSINPKASGKCSIGSPHYQQSLISLR